MCERISDIRAALSRFAAAFDVARLSAEDAGRVVADAAAVEASAAALKALAAARAVDGGAYAGRGGHLAAEELAAVVGLGTGAARELIVTGRRLADQPEVAAAAKAGVLSPAKAALVANAAAADPAAAGRLVELAGQSSVASLREECARVKAGVGDAEGRRRTIHARRRLRAWTDVEGVWHLTAEGNPEDGAQVMSALSPGVEARFRAARDAGDRESPAAYAFDALVAVAREVASYDGGEEWTPAGGSVAPPDGDAEWTPAGGSVAAPDNSARAVPSGEQSRTPDRSAEAVPSGGERGAAPGLADVAPPGGPPLCASGVPARAAPRRRRRGAPVKLLVRIDYDTFLRGVAREGETCELVGYGPIAVSAVHDLIATGDPFVAAILTKGRELVGVAHLGRRPRAAQQSALQWLYPSCAVRDCTAQARLEADHRIDWAATHYTVFDLLDLLCHRHHAQKTRENWALVPGSGKRDFVPPSDPRHPRHARALAAV